MPSLIFHRTFHYKLECSTLHSTKVTLSPSSMRILTNIPDFGAARVQPEALTPLHKEVLFELL